MAELSFNTYTELAFILYFQLELFFYLCYTNFIFFVKQLKLNKTMKQRNNLLQNSTNSLYFIFLFIFLVINKSFNCISVVQFLAFLAFTSLLDRILFSFSLFAKVNSNFYNLILPLVVTSIYLLTTIKSFLALFFFIEVYSVFYYFSFLTTHTIYNQTLLKYKNGLLMLLWNNFLTSFFLALGVYFLLKSFGTSDFLELSLVTSSSSYIYIYLIGLCWKLGFPLFHFFKLEVYKYLLRENVFFFSIITTLINITILYFILSQTIVFNTIYLNNLIIIPIIFTINVVVINLKIHNILYYFAISSLLTITTITCLFLI